MIHIRIKTKAGSTESRMGKNKGGRKKNIIWLEIIFLNWQFNVIGLK